MLNCLEKESFSMHASMLGIGLREDQAWRRTSVVLLFSPDAKPMQNRDFPLAIGMLFGVTAVTRCTPEKCTFDRWNVSFFGTFTWPDLSPRWWPWQHWASQGPCASWQPESMSRKGGVHAVHNSFLVSKTRRFRETFQIAFDSDFWVAVAMAF